MLQSRCQGLRRVTQTMKRRTGDLARCGWMRNSGVFFNRVTVCRCSCTYIISPMTFSSSPFSSLRRSGVAERIPGKGIVLPLLFLFFLFFLLLFLFLFLLLLLLLLFLLLLLLLLLFPKMHDSQSTTLVRDL